MIKIYTRNHSETLIDSLLEAQGILSKEQKKHFLLDFMISKAQNLNYFYFMAGLCCFWETSVEDGYVESLLFQSGTWQTFQMEKKRSLKCVVALFSQVYILPGLFGPTHLFIDGYFKEIYFCRAQLALRLLSASKERVVVKSINLSLRKTLKLISSEANTDDIVEAANILTTK